MSKRTISYLMLAALAALLTAAPAFAGGWAVVTLDRLPEQVVSGEALDIGFMVRQHGQTPLSGLTPNITVTRADTGESFSVTAKDDGAAGHYAAALTFPSGGTWRWNIDAFGFAQPMPALAVRASTLSPAPSSLVSLKAPAQKRVFDLPAYVAQAIKRLGAALRERPATTPRPAEQIGQDLFLAKGCMMCHQHDAVREARKVLGDFSIGPDLTHRKLDPDYLRTWLKDPKAVKPATQMPNLELKKDEIEALIAFLTADAGN
jgi:cytochrome c2